MRRRAAIAPAVVADADVLLMDEPFSALDEPSTRLLLQEQLQDLLARTDRSLLFVTHSIDEPVCSTRFVSSSSAPVRRRSVPSSSSPSSAHAS